MEAQFLERFLVSCSETTNRYLYTQICTHLIFSVFILHKEDSAWRSWLHPEKSQTFKTRQDILLNNLCIISCRNYSVTPHVFVSIYSSVFGTGCIPSQASEKSQKTLLDKKMIRMCSNPGLIGLDPQWSESRKQSFILMMAVIQHNKLNRDLHRTNRWFHYQLNYLIPWYLLHCCHCGFLLL